MARYVLTAEERELRNHFKMQKWYEKDFRRRRYFDAIDFQLQWFQGLGIEPPDHTVRSVLAIMITGDDSFVSHILKKNEANPDYTTLRSICAGAIYESYIRAREDGRWPE